MTDFATATGSHGSWSRRRWEDGVGGFGAVGDLGTTPSVLLLNLSQSVDKLAVECLAVRPVVNQRVAVWAQRTDPSGMIRTTVS